MQRSPSASPAPFVTRRSTLGFSAACLISGLFWQALAGADASGSGTTGVELAVSGAVALVSGAVAWVEGIVLALRANSTLWLVVAILPFAPINSVMCAMFCPASPPAKKR